MAEQSPQSQSQGQETAQGSPGRSSSSEGQEQGGRSSEQLQKEMQRLREDLRKVQGDLQQIAESAVGWGRQSYEQARDLASQRVETGMDQIEQYVRERPITTVLVAFGLGLITGTIFRR